MNKQTIWIIVIVIAVAGVILYTRSSEIEDGSDLSGQTEELTETAGMIMEGDSSEDAMMESLDESMMMGIKTMNFSHTGSLADVTGGNSSGNASFNFVDGKYNLFAIFSNLPEPTNDDFYEGWIVQKSPFKFISTGKVEKDENGIYTNVYSSGQDLSSYDFYVLTIEPNDGDPAPAGHIVEGTMTRKN